MGFMTGQLAVAGTDTGDGLGVRWTGTALMARAVKAARNARRAPEMNAHEYEPVDWA
jgi:hypothetical protein